MFNLVAVVKHYTRTTITSNMYQSIKRKIFTYRVFYQRLFFRQRSQ